MSTGVSKPKTCLADGHPSQLLIASDNKLRRLSPFKAGDISDSVFSPGSIRIEAADVYYNATEVGPFLLFSAFKHNISLSRVLYSLENRLSYSGAVPTIKASIATTWLCRL